MKWVLRRLSRNDCEKQVREFIDCATRLGLRDEDRSNAIDLLQNNEAGEAFDIVVTQLYEYDIKVDCAFIERAHEIGDLLKIDRRHYDLLEHLVEDV